MTKIAQVAQTDCAVMTNIGVAHIEQLGSKENILKRSSISRMEWQRMVFFSSMATILSCER